MNRPKNTGNIIGIEKQFDRYGEIQTDRLTPGPCYDVFNAIKEKLLHLNPRLNSWNLSFMEVLMAAQSSKSLKSFHFISIGIMIAGFCGILFSLAFRPAAFPTFFLFLTALGAMLSVAVSTKYLAWRQYE